MFLKPFIKEIGIARKTACEPKELIAGISYLRGAKWQSRPFLPVLGLLKFVLLHC